MPFSTLGLEAGSKRRLSSQSEGQARPQLCNPMTTAVVDLIGKNK